MKRFRSLPRVIAALDAMRAAANRDGPAATLELDGAFLTMLGELIAAYGHTLPPAPRLNNRRLARAVDYAEIHIAATLTVGELASAAAMSPSAFSRAFRAATGETPWAFVSRRHLERAGEQMARTDDTLMQVAADCGFADASHLTRTWRRVHGKTPRGGAWFAVRTVFPSWSRVFTQPTRHRPTSCRAIVVGWGSASGSSMTRISRVSRSTSSIGLTMTHSGKPAARTIPSRRVLPSMIRPRRAGSMTSPKTKRPCRRLSPAPIAVVDGPPFQRRVWQGRARRTAAPVLRCAGIVQRSLACRFQVFERLHGSALSSDDPRGRRFRPMTSFGMNR